MAGRKLFVSDIGLEALANYIYRTTLDMTDVNFVDVIECKDYILNQLRLASKMAKISSISVTDSGQIRVRTNDLFIKTEDTGILRKFFIGKWLISFDKYGDYLFNTIGSKELKFNSDVWGNGTVHPHISGRNRHGCLGNAEAPLQYYLKIGAIKTVCMYLIGYLESVNINDSAGRELGHCKEVELDDNGAVLHDEEGNYKFKTNEFDANGSFKVANTVSSNIDTKYHEYITMNYRRCIGCDTVHNFNHFSHTDASTGDYVCEDCVANMKRCSVCGKVAYRVVHDDVNDLDYCTKCCDILFEKCSLCDEYIFYPIDTSNKLTSILEAFEVSFRKQYRIMKKDTNNICRIQHVCKDCKDAAMARDDGMIPKYTKLPIANPSVVIEDKAMLSKVLVRGVGALGEKYIEDVIPSFNKTNGRFTEANGSVLGAFTITGYSDNMLIDNMFKEYIRRNYIKVLTVRTKDKIKITHAPWSGNAGTPVPRCLFKDKEVFYKFKEGDVIEYDIEGREQ